MIALVCCLLCCIVTFLEKNLFSFHIFFNKLAVNYIYLDLTLDLTLKHITQTNRQYLQNTRKNYSLFIRRTITVSNFYITHYFLLCVYIFTYYELQKIPNLLKDLLKFCFIGGVSSRRLAKIINFSKTVPMNKCTSALNSIT